MTAETSSPTLTLPMLVTLPVTAVARVTAAVTARSPRPTVIEVALTAVTGPPTSRRRGAPAGSDGNAPEPPAAGAPELGVAAAVGAPAASWTATVTRPNPAPAATSAVRPSSRP